MRQLLASLLVLALGCSSTSQAPAAQRTMPEPLVAADLPPHPREEFVVPPQADWAVGVDGYYLIDRDTKERKDVDRAGVCMSLEKAGRAARFVVRYDELRGLYLIDLRTWGRERKIYERYLEVSEAETKRAQKTAERTWFERNAGPIGLTLGLILGITASAIGAAAIDNATE